MTLISDTTAPRPASPPPLDRLPQGRRHPQDTADGCFERAAADRVRALGMGTPIGRAKLEHSASTWQGRGEMLHRLERSFAARAAASVAA